MLKFQVDSVWDTLRATQIYHNFHLMTKCYNTLSFFIAGQAPHWWVWSATRQLTHRCEVWFSAILKHIYFNRTGVLNRTQTADETDQKNSLFALQQLLTGRQKQVITDLLLFVRCRTNCSKMYFEYLRIKKTLLRISFKSKWDETLVIFGTVLSWKRKIVFYS